MPPQSSVYFSLQEEFKRSWLTSLIGLLVFTFGVWLLTWNEGRAVHHAHSLDEAYNNVISLNIYERIRPEFEGRLVHMSGPLIINEPLTEPDYGISVQAVKLKRRVQMYQWVEERSPRDYAENVADESYQNSDYFYLTEWRDRLVDSSSFYIRHGHQNPMEIPLKSTIYVSRLVKVGNFILGDDLKNKFDDYTEVTSDERPENSGVKLHMGIYYHCEDVWHPEVGDIRVQFYHAGVAGEKVTVIGMQKDGILVPYITAKGHRLALLRHGQLDVNQMFNAEYSDIRWETWKFRAAGVVVLYASFVMLSKLIRILREYGVFEDEAFTFCQRRNGKLYTFRSGERYLERRDGRCLKFEPQMSDSSELISEVGRGSICSKPEGSNYFGEVRKGFQSSSGNYFMKNKIHNYNGFDCVFSHHLAFNIHVLYESIEQTRIKKLEQIVKILMTYLPREETVSEYFLLTQARGQDGLNSLCRMMSKSMKI